MLKVGFGVASLVVWAGPALAHELDREIDDCRCDAGCDTAEVSGLSCSGGAAAFSANGLPASDHPLMLGITGSNQQFPVPHDYRHDVPAPGNVLASPRATEPGPIGVAVNGIPIFDPSTQGPEQAATGKPISAADAGELDVCGGHAGRGDDYHYHMAPVCLIEEMGAEAVETLLRPIGFANDGYPILAIGFFDPAARIEDKLDDCRGAQDAAGRYFYNVEPDGDYAVLDCFKGEPTGRSGDKSPHRQAPEGGDFVGMPIKFEITEATRGLDACHVLTGRFSDNGVMTGAQARSAVSGEEGSIFYCSASCYGYFLKNDSGNFPGRSIYFARETSGCAPGFAPAEQNAFLGYWAGKD